MRRWFACLGLGIVGAGFGGAAFGLPQEMPFFFPVATISPAQKLWESGQKAITDGNPEAAIRLYKQSLAVDPTLHRNHLSLAAAYLESGEDKQAADSMERYLDREPGHLSVRQHYGDLLIKLGRLPEARMQLDRFVAEAQKQAQHEGILLHAHGRLLEIAETADDSYEEHLHRGIGLFYLANQPVAPGTPVENQPETLLCKAALQLNQAVRLKPQMPRPRLYLTRIWQKLGQTQPALQALHEAEALQWEGELTTWERSSLWTLVAQKGKLVG
jgi:tetratricopeptide (TPR) repeat protein